MAEIVENVCDLTYTFEVLARTTMLQIALVYTFGRTLAKVSWDTGFMTKHCVPMRLRHHLTKYVRAKSGAEASCSWRCLASSVQCQNCFCSDLSSYRWLKSYVKRCEAELRTHNPTVNKEDVHTMFLKHFTRSTAGRSCTDACEQCAVCSDILWIAVAFSKRRALCVSQEYYALRVLIHAHLTISTVIAIDPNEMADAMDAIETNVGSDA